jgi:hypothetical protein
LEDLQELGVAFVSLAEGIDATTPGGKLQMHTRARQTPKFRRPRRVGRTLRSTQSWVGPRHHVRCALRYAVPTATAVS